MSGEASGDTIMLRSAAVAGMVESGTYGQALERVVASLAEGRALVYEITDAPRLDPTLWRFAVALAAACREAGRPFAVACPSKSARGYFGVTGLDQVLAVTDTVGEALALAGAKS
jgi:anti-anti-sigma regulatory factor